MINTCIHVSHKHFPLQLNHLYVVLCAGRLQDRIAAKSRRLLETESRLMGTYYPTAEVQQQRQQELQRTLQEQIAAQAAER